MSVCFVDVFWLLVDELVEVVEWICVWFGDWLDGVVLWWFCVVVFDVLVDGDVLIVLVGDCVV